MTAINGLRESLISGLGFGLVFTGYYTLAAYQASVNRLIGVLSLAIVYGTFCLGSLVSPMLLRWTSEKYLFMIGCGMHSLFVFANIKVYPGVLLASAGLVGLGGSIIWTAQGSFLYKVSVDEPHHLGRNSGVFWGIYISSLVIGNLLASTLLLFTGITTLFIVLGVISGMGCLVFLGVATTPREDVVSPVYDILGFFKQPRMLLFIPISIVSGVLTPLVYSKYSLEVPQSQIGFYFAVYGATDALGGFFFGWMSDAIGRIPVLVIGFILNTVGIGVCDVAINVKKEEYLFVGLSLLGAGDAATQTQVASILTKMQPHAVASAFSWKTVVYAITACGMYLMAGYVSLMTMELISVVMCTVGMGCVMVIDRVVR